MKELIGALQFVLAFAESEGKLDPEQYGLVHNHIQSLEDLTIRNDAMALITKLLTEHVTITQDTAAGCLAKVCVMLTMYGSKPDAMLAVIHDKGWEVVTLADVEAVRKFILEQ